MIINGDSLEVLKDLEDNSVDGVVTDPPYGLNFMGKYWDKEDNIAFNKELWKEVLRVLKPGGYLLSFGGSRTYHRMASAIEDAGFEIRDQMMWIYGSGFPKSYNISKGIDKKLGKERKVVGEKPNRQKSQYNNANGVSNFAGGSAKNSIEYITAPASDLAKQYDGYGTALKPAHEPIVVARKPIEGTNVDNVIKYGTAGLNIDDCRINTREKPQVMGSKKTGNTYGKIDVKGGKVYTEGRFPANVIFDEEAGKILDEQSGVSSGGKYKAPNARKRKAHSLVESSGTSNAPDNYGDKGGASRFFYCAKVSKKERGEGNNHPTVKPIKLLKYLITLITPPTSTPVILDPFAGSGSTGLAIKQLNEEKDLDIQYILIEREEEYVEIIYKRLKEEVNI